MFDLFRRLGRRPSKKVAAKKKQSVQASTGETKSRAIRARPILSKKAERMSTSNESKPVAAQSPAIPESSAVASTPAAPKKVVPKRKTDELAPFGILLLPGNISGHDDDLSTVGSFSVLQGLDQPSEPSNMLKPQPEEPKLDISNESNCPPKNNRRETMADAPGLEILREDEEAERDSSDFKRDRELTSDRKKATASVEQAHATTANSSNDQGAVYSVSRTRQAPLPKGLQKDKTLENRSIAPARSGDSVTSRRSVSFAPGTAKARTETQILKGYDTDNESDEDSDSFGAIFSQWMGFVPTKPKLNTKQKKVRTLRESVWQPNDDDSTNSNEERYKRLGLGKRLQSKGKITQQDDDGSTNSLLDRLASLGVKSKSPPTLSTSELIEAQPEEIVFDGFNEEREAHEGEILSYLGGDTAGSPIAEMLRQEEKDPRDEVEESLQCCPKETRERLKLQSQSPKITETDDEESSGSEIEVVVVADMDDCSKTSGMAIHILDDASTTVMVLETQATAQ